MSRLQTKQKISKVSNLNFFQQFYQILFKNATQNIKLDLVIFLLFAQLQQQSFDFLGKPQKQKLKLMQEDKQVQVATILGIEELKLFQITIFLLKLLLFMITRLSKTFSFSKNVFHITNPKPPLIKPKPIPPKAPIAQLKNGQLHLSTVAQQLNLNEQILRKQLINPKSSVINKQELKILSIINGKDLSGKINEDQVKMTKKSPVVTIMGHVDHGKTTLIDYLRKSNIAEGEIGGITQKIGAFHITCHNQKITFIDTPGHQAFSNMRKRGAFVTDLIVLIVASTQGVKKQTKEVIDIINRDKIRTIVAITKIDLPNCDTQGVQQSIFQAGLNIQPKGGNVPVVHISAKTGQNVDLLSELILQQTKDLKGYEGGQAEGIVLQAYQNNSGMNAMTLIVKQGVLKQGSILVIGEQYTRVKNMYDDGGNELKEAKPGDAVQITGIPNIPAAGDFIYEVEDESKAKFITIKKKQLISEEMKKQTDKETVKTSKIRLDYRSRKAMYGSASNNTWISKFAQKQQQIIEQIEKLRVLAEKDPSVEKSIQQKQLELKNHKEYVYQFLINIGENVNNFNVILKFSDRGIEETIHQQLEAVIERIKTKHNITVNILRSDVGQIAKSQISQAATCKAEIFSFGAQPNHQAVSLMNELQINPKVHKLIHTFLKDFEESAVNRKKNSIKGTEKGRATIANIFPIKGKKGTNDIVYIPGIVVNSGKISKENKLYIFRNGSPINTGLFAKSIKSFKKEVHQIKKGQECTITFDTLAQVEMQKGDQIVAYEQ